MTSLKKFLFITIAGGVGGIIAAIFILPILVKVNFLNTATILAKLSSLPQAPVEETKEKPTAVTQPNLFTEAINNIGPSVVSVQSFYKGELFRSGSGIILTQDGLIATLSSFVPASAEILQVTGRDKIYKARAVFRNYADNIALLSIIGESDLPVARLNSDLPDLGDRLLVFGRLVGFGKDDASVAEALVSQVDKVSGNFKISFQFDQGMYGAAVSDSEGSVRGLIDYHNQRPLVIFSKKVSDTLNSYLTKAKQ